MNTTSSDNWLTRTGEALWLIAAAAIPLAFSPWTHNAFELPKTALLKALVLLMGLVTLIRVIDGQKEQASSIPRSLLWPALILGGAAALATLASVNPRTSLWGSYERQQGLLTQLAYLGLFPFTAVNLRTRAQVHRLLATIAWGSTPALVYGLLQAVGIDPLDWRTDAASPVLSTVGRANFMGSYLVLVIPLTIGRTFLARRRWPYLLLIACQVVCLALTQARGAWVGLSAAMVAGLGAWALAIRDRRPALVALLILGLIAALVILLNWPDGPLAALAQLPGLDRVATLAQTDRGSSAARLTIWRTALPLATARPWLGYGPETMRAVFSRVFPPQLVYYQGRHTTVDRAHNLWLDLGMSIGVAGIAAFAALLASFGRLAWQGLRDDRGQWHKVVWAALAAGIVGHLADLQFSFDLTTSATVFWLALAVGASVNRARDSGCVPSINDSAQTPILYVLPTLLVSVLIGLLCVRPLAADAAYQHSLQGMQPLKTAQRAIQLWPMEPRYRLRLAETLAQNGDLVAAASQIDSAIALSPNDPKVWAAAGSMYGSWGSIAPSYYVEAEAAFRRALELAPDIATHHTALGAILVQQGRLEEGLVEFECAVDLDATDGVAFRHLAQVYEALGQKDKATWARNEAERWGDE